MLQRRAKRVALMLNTAVPLDQDVDFCNPPDGFDPSGKVAGDLSDKFGFPGPQVQGAMFYNKNQVFAKEELLPLLCEFRQLLSAGSPLVARRSLQVQENSWWGISGGDEVEVVFFLLDACKEFEALLPNDTRQELGKGAAGMFNNFPQYKTTFQTADFTALSASQANLLAAQTEYSVLKSADVFKAVLLIGASSMMPPLGGEVPCRKESGSSS